jgi:hypothetical protein
LGDRSQLYNDLENSLRLAFDGLMSGVWTACPGIIIDVDFVNLTCSVQLAIQAQVTDENGQVTYVNLPVLIHVPICFPKAGGFLLTLPIKKDDEVLVVFSSRCIDSWWQLGGVQRPMELRMHDLSDGFCIPGPCSVPNIIPNVSSTGAQLRNKAGTTYVELSDDGKIKLVSPSEIDVTGNLKVAGAITATGDVQGHFGTIAPISLTGHTHTSAAPGSPTSGPLP